MSLIHTAVTGGIFDRAMDILEDTSLEVTQQITAGATEIRAYRIWRGRTKRHGKERRQR